MYKDYRQKKVDFEIDVNSYELSCGGCPTVYDFQDTEGTNYYFRLRHGYAYLRCEDNGKDLVDGNMEGFDGICNWIDLVEWAAENGVKINY